MWRLYGWFSGLMLCGSSFGIVAWAAWTQRTDSNYKANDRSFMSSRTTAQRMAMYSLAARYNAVYSVTYAAEFLCLTVAKLLVLDRIAHFSKLLQAKRWLVARQVVVAVVVLGNSVSLAGNVAAASYFERASHFAALASSSFASNSSVDGKAHYALSLEQFENAVSISSVKSICDLAVLLLIIVAFVAVGIMCSRLIWSFVRSSGSLEAIAGGKHV